MLETRIQNLLGRRPQGEIPLDSLKLELANAPLHAIVATLPRLSAHHQVMAYRLLAKDRAMVVFDQLAPDEQSALVNAMGTGEVAALFEELDPDDRVRLFEELPAKVAKRIVATLSREARCSVATMLGYPAESAGRAMSPRYLAVREGVSCAQALEAVRTSALRADEVRALFVLDDQRRYRGYVLIADLLRAPAEAPVIGVAETADVSVRAAATRLEAARRLQEVDLPAIPVLDAEGRMVGAITFDDVIDVLQMDASETMYQKCLAPGFVESVV
jgi:magnesium transporter